MRLRRDVGIALTSVGLGALPFVGAASRVAAQEAAPVTLGHDPAAARLVTQDISRFWTVVRGATVLTIADDLQRDYIDAGTPGLRDFVPNRIESGRNLAATVATHAKFYAAIRRNTMAVDTAVAIKSAIRKSFHALHDLYPDAVFPDVYFVVGALSSGGTVSPRGLLIGVDMYGRDSTTPVGELSPWERASTGQLADLSGVVAHELIHFEQSPALGNDTTLLAHALAEGAADFVGYMISGRLVNRAQHAYGQAHERALWDEFSHEMLGSDMHAWLYQADRAKDRPADLGYYIGFQICKAFYDRTPDKRRAIREIITVSDARAFLAASGYAPR